MTDKVKGKEKIERNQVFPKVHRKMKQNEAGKRNNFAEAKNSKEA